MSHDATNWAIKQRGLKPAAKVVLWNLCDRYHPDNGCFPNQDTLARDCEMSRSTLNDHLAALEAAGLIRREQRRDSRTKRQKSTVYRFAFEPDFHEKPSPETGHGAVSENGADPCPENGESRVRNPDTNPVREPVKEPEREAREGDWEDRQPEEAASDDRADQPGTAAFEKRVMRFCSGAGYAAGPWPNWDKGAAPKWIFAQFANLSPEERTEAERWRDPYLIDVKRRNVPESKVVGVGSFFNGKMWTGLDPAILELAERRKQVQLGPDEQAKPDGWATMLGPVGMARLFALLIAGQQTGEPQPGAIWLEARLRRDWPAVHQWKQLQQLKGGIVFGEQWHTLKDAMEPVPRDSDALSAWRAAFAQRGWPWLAVFDRLDVVFCPKGGPARLLAFEATVRQAQVKEAAE